MQGGRVKVELARLVGGGVGASRREKLSEASVDAGSVAASSSAHARRQRVLEEIPGDVDRT